VGQFYIVYAYLAFGATPVPTLPPNPLLCHETLMRCFMTSLKTITGWANSTGWTREGGRPYDPRNNDLHFVPGAKPIGKMSSFSIKR